jgi:hypothetical protein
LISLSFKDNLFTFERNAKIREIGLSFGSHQYLGNVEGSEMKLTLNHFNVSRLTLHQIVQYLREGMDPIEAYSRAEKEYILPEMGFEIVGIRYHNGKYLPSKEHLQSVVSESYGMSLSDYLKYKGTILMGCPEMSQTFESLMTEE